MAVLGMMFFAGVLAVALWSIVATLQPRLGRIAFLLEHGPVAGVAPPLPPRVRVTARTVPPRTAHPVRLRAAA